MDDMTRCELLKTISEYQFVAVELNLYLDTHPAYELRPLGDCYGLLCLQRMALGLRRKRLNVDLSEKA